MKKYREQCFEQTHKNDVDVHPVIMKRYCNLIKDDSVSELELENRKISYKAALEGIVLLKNNGILPLKSKNIALFGAGVTRTVKGGTGSGEVNERYCVSIFDGMKNAGFNITSNSWLEDYEKEYSDAFKAYLTNKSKVADTYDALKKSFCPPEGRLINENDIDKNTDVAIYVVSRQAGEGLDKRIEFGDFDLSKLEVENVNFLIKHFKDVILVINSGSYMDLKNLDEKCSGLIFFAQEGEEGGNAFASLVKGEVSPSGKLTDTWAKSYKDVPFGDCYSHRNNDTENEFYHEDIYVGYRYYDTYKIQPKYPFGFGLSYTNFEIKFNSIGVDGNKINLKCIVTNKGNFRGKEIVQIYASMPNGKINKEYKRLVAFEKTKELKEGESQTLLFDFDFYNLASFNEKISSYILEKGKYIICLGNSSENIKPCAIINLNEDKVISKLENILKLDKDFEKLEGVKNEYSFNLDNVKRVEVDAKTISETETKYKTPDILKDQKVNEILNKLSIRDMVNLLSGEGLVGMFSTKKLFTPGAVGRTTSKLYKKGLINLNLSDGPAGLRLLKKYSLTKNGTLKFYEDGLLLGFMQRLPKFLIKPFLARKNSQTYYQFLTSFPVGTAIAQSWNKELAQEIGEAISREMDKYNISFFLGPAMNIHRNPLCGRNFEYFSEDPLLSGFIASSISKGIESIKGNYATIKHFACNNQEDNRQHSNSHVSERALREIYLKGFEICVKNSNVHSVMTSYNMINGIYTADSYDLCTKALRNEWGFKGIVMSDWLSTRKTTGTNPEAIKAGNDMLMPGGIYYKRTLYRGYKKGIVSLDDLKRASANMINLIINSNVATRKENQITPKTFN